MRFVLTALLAIALATPVLATPSDGSENGRRVLTLDEALRTARRNQPQLAQAQASVLAAEARVDVARSRLLPQVHGSVNLQGGLTQAFGGLDNVAPIAGGRFSAGISASQHIWDFGRTPAQIGASRANAEAQATNAKTTEQSVTLNVQSTFFDARAKHAAVDVAKAQLANRERHLAQTDAAVKAGLKPPIDLAQVRTARANALMQLVSAENAYEVAKARLNQAMGLEQFTDYDVADEALPPVEGEDAPLATLLEEAQRNRPELAALDAQLRAQELTASAARAAHFPSLGATASVSEAGSDLEALARPNWSVGLSLSVPIFQGGAISAQVREAAANLAQVEARAKEVRLQVRLEVEQAVRALVTSRKVLDAAQVAADSAREQLTLAEARYATGVGNTLELADAQLNLTDAELQRVQADFQLASARAQLARALGRSLTAD